MRHLLHCTAASDSGRELALIIEDLMRGHIEPCALTHAQVEQRERRIYVRRGCEFESDIGDQSNVMPPEMKERPGKSLASD